MVLAYHLIWTAYGWWLPNDLRGSMPRAIASDVIAALGKLHYGRKRVQPASRDIRAFGVGRPVWGGPGWKVYIDSTDDIERTVRYVRDNPLKAKLPVRVWDFVTPYDGWPLRGGRAH